MSRKMSSPCDLTLTTVVCRGICTAGIKSKCYGENTWCKGWWNVSGWSTVQTGIWSVHSGHVIAGNCLLDQICTQLCYVYNKIHSGSAEDVPIRVGKILGNSARFSLLTNILRKWIWYKCLVLNRRTLWLHSSQWMIRTCGGPRCVHVCCSIFIMYTRCTQVFISLELVCIYLALSSLFSWNDNFSLMFFYC